MSLYLPSTGWYGSVAAPTVTCSHCHVARASSLPQDLGDVRLHADRRPVAVVRRPVRALLERPDVTERAAVDAAHVRVQRPLEAHALHRVEGALAGLFAILDPHVLGREYRTDVRTARRRYSAAHAAAADRPEARPLLPGGRARSSTRASGSETRRGGRWRSSASRSPTSIPTTSAEPEAAAQATGAPVYQGGLDYAQCERVWGSDDWPERIAAWFVRHGVPAGCRRRPDRAGSRVRAVHPLRGRPRAALRRQRGRRLAGRSSFPVTPTATSASSATAC